MTALMTAAHNGHRRIVEALIQHGATVDLLMKVCHCPVHHITIVLLCTINIYNWWSNKYLAKWEQAHLHVYSCASGEKSYVHVSVSLLNCNHALQCTCTPQANTL